MPTDPYEDRIEAIGWPNLTASQRAALNQGAYTQKITVHDPVADALNCLAANVGALAFAIDAYTQLRKKETTNNG